MYKTLYKHRSKMCSLARKLTILRNYLALYEGNRKGSGRKKGRERGKVYKTHYCVFVVL